MQATRELLHARDSSGVTAAAQCSSCSALESWPCSIKFLLCVPRLLPLQTVLSIILGGGAGSRLYPLTKKRAKPAVPLGANYRLIDIPVSNCINSNITKIYTLTQFNSASLNRHLSQAYVSAGVGWVLLQKTACWARMAGR